MIYYYIFKMAVRYGRRKLSTLYYCFFFINRNENTISSFAVVDIDITDVWQISMLLFRFVYIYIYIIILSKFTMKALTIVFLKLRNIFFIQFQIEFLEYISKIIVLLRRRYFCISITRIT